MNRLAEDLVRFRNGAAYNRNRKVKGWRAIFALSHNYDCEKEARKYDNWASGVEHQIIREGQMK